MLVEVEDMLRPLKMKGDSDQCSSKTGTNPSSHCAVIVFASRLRLMCGLLAKNSNPSQSSVLYSSVILVLGASARPRMSTYRVGIKRTQRKKTSITDQIT